MSDIERTDPMTCLACGEVLTGRRKLDGTVTEDVDGDVSICLYCSHLAIYDPAQPGGLREPTDAERFALEVDDGVQAAVAATRRWQYRQAARLN